MLEQRGYLCHGEAVQMKNLRLDSPDSVKQHAQAIYQQVVVQKLMPMNNATGITDAERALIGPQQSTRAQRALIAHLTHATAQRAEKSALFAAL